MILRLGLVIIATALIAATITALILTHSSQPPQTGSTIPAPPPQDTNAPAPSIVVDESVSNGTYTFSGSLPVPSACDTLSSSLMMPGGNSVLTLRLSLLKVVSGACQNEPGAVQSFTDSFEPGDPTAKVTLSSVIFNDKTATFTLRTLP